MFWREDSPWPYAHYTWPLALFVLTRNVWVTLVVVYVWESTEQVLAHTLSAADRAAFVEPHWDDSWLGDPLMGALGSGTFALFAHTIGWSDACEATTPISVRAVAFIVPALIGFALLSYGGRRRANGGDGDAPPLAVSAAAVVVHTLVHVGIVYLAYGPGADAECLAYVSVWNAVHVVVALVCVVPWLCGTERRAAFAADASGGCPAFSRVFGAGLVLLLATLVYVLVVDIDAEVAAA